jgi:hypothetical protein
VCFFLRPDLESECLHGRCAAELSIDHVHFFSIQHPVGLPRIFGHLPETALSEHRSDAV